MKIETVYKANNMYFSGNNKQYFGDINYSTIKSASGKFYFLNHTNMWSDMFDGEKKACYRLHTLEQYQGKILDIVNDIFPDRLSVTKYLENK